MGHKLTHNVPSSPHSLLSYHTHYYHPHPFASHPFLTLFPFVAFFSHPFPIFLSALSYSASHHLFITLWHPLVSILAVFQKGTKHVQTIRPRHTVKDMRWDSLSLHPFLIVLWLLDAKWQDFNHMGTIFTAPSLSFGSVSNKGADWEQAWVYSKVFWEGVQRTYLLCGEENGNALMSEGTHGWDSSVVQGWETHSEVGSWVTRYKWSGWANCRMELCFIWRLTHPRSLHAMCQMWHMERWGKM